MKVIFSIKKLKFFPITTISSAGVPTYGTGIDLPGTVSLSLDPEGESTIVYADGIAYVTLGSAASYTGTLENLLFPTEILKEIYGYLVDTNQNLVETDASPKEFGMKFACDSDEEEVYFTLYRVSSTKPGINVQTKESSVTVNPQSVNLTVSTVTTEDGQNILKSFAKKGDSNYATYFTSAPTMPTFSAGSGGD